MELITCSVCGIAKPRSGYKASNGTKRCKTCYNRLKRQREGIDPSVKLKRVSVPCYAQCGEKITIEIDPADKLPRKLCSYCLENGAPEWSSRTDRKRVENGNQAGF